jgi:hypothetical protein
MSTPKGSRQRRRLWSVTQAVVRAPGRGGEETPSVPESSGDGYEEEGEDEEEGEITPSPHSLPLKTSLRLVSSLAGKQGSPLLHADRNAPGREPGHHLTHYHNPVSR